MSIGQESSASPSILIKNYLWWFQKRKTWTFSIQSPIRRFLFKPLNSQAKRGVFVRLKIRLTATTSETPMNERMIRLRQRIKRAVGLEAGVVSAAKGGARPTSQCAARSAAQISHSFDEIGGR
jgi:hypothetical protein